MAQAVPRGLQSQSSESTTPEWHPDCETVSLGYHTSRAFADCFQVSSNASSRKSLVYTSTGEVLFALDETRIICCAPGMPRTPPNSHARVQSKSVVRYRKPIPLPESSDILSVLFQFVLPKASPTLVGLKIDQLVPLSQTARNYKVYSAVSLAESRLL